MNNKIKLTAIAVALSLAFVGCGNENKEDTNQNATTSEQKVEDTNTQDSEANKDAAEDNKEENKDENADKEKEDDKSSETSNTEATEGKLVLRRSYQAPHGEGSFARIAVVTDADKIVNVSIDEFQYFDEGSDFKPLPNQDEDTDFKKGNAEGKILGSKVVNDEAYSKMMVDKAKSTVSIADNYKAIQDFAKGKTIAELEEVVNAAEDGKAIDAVTGATLVDTKGYLQAIIDTAKDDTIANEFEANSADDIEVKQFFGTAGAKNAVTDTFVVLEDGKIIAAQIDELQYIGENGLPNSDKKFGENYADSSKKLSSKLVNNEEYSKLMADKAKSTHTLAENFKAIEDFVVGKTPEEIKEVIDGNENGKPVDAISGATLVNTVGYLQEIYTAATQNN